jgi:CHAT domain-containing protein
MRAVLFALALIIGLPAQAAEKPDPAALRDEAYQAAQLAMSSAAGAALSQLGARFSAGTDELARAVRARQDLAEAATRVDRQITQARATPDDAQASRIAALRAEADGLRNRIETVEADLAQRFPAFAELARPQPLSIAATQALLRDDEALALVFVARNDTFVWALTRDAVDWTRAPVKRAAMIGKVKLLRAGLNPQAYALLRSGLRNFGEASVEGGEDSGRTPFDRRAAHELYQALLQPLEKILAGKARLITVVNTPFDSLPMGVLVTAPPTGSDVEPADLRATPWLMRRQALVSLPAVSSLRALRMNANPRVASEPFRGYGAPLLGPKPGAAPPEKINVASGGAVSSLYRGGALDRAAFDQLAPLPQTEGELKAIAAALGAGPDAVRVGAAATAAAVLKDDLSRFRVVAFATHGLLAGELSGLEEPALVFTPPETPTPDDNGLVTASQAAKLDLAADWVVLSACNTAGGDGAPGAEGFSGLARAFFYAGAKSLLVSHWPVRDDVAARMTTRMFAGLRGDGALARAEAHRRVTLEIIDDARDASLAHPAVWAPFVVVGEGK